MSKGRVQRTKLSALVDMPFVERQPVCLKCCKCVFCTVVVFAAGDGKTAGVEG